MSECIFCQIIDKKIPADIVYEDDNFLAFNDINPKAKVHVLIIPKLHIASLNELTAEHKAIVADLTLLIPKLAAQLGLDKGYRTIVNTGSGGGQEVFHLHYHLLGGGMLPGF